MNEAKNVFNESTEEKSTNVDIYAKRITEHVAERVWKPQEERKGEKKWQIQTTVHTPDGSEKERKKGTEKKREE